MSDIKGFIFNIERFTLHDGPGIRTTVFLKGCPLQCAWCCNPESQLLLPQLAFFQEKCIGCGDCISLCPRNAIISNGEHNPIRVNYSLCDGCGKCVPVCIPQALIMLGEEISAAEVAAEVIRDKTFYTHSGGGVTLSGGEPFAQPAFSAEILKLCKNADIHTAIQTSGYAEKTDIDQLITWLDLVILDIKILEPVDHLKWTGKTNQRILANLAYLDSLKKEIVLQVPLIPGINDSEEKLTAVLNLAKSFNSVTGISLLNYHSLGVGKYARIGRSYDLDQLSAVEPQYLLEKMHWAEQFDVPLVKFNG